MSSHPTQLNPDQLLQLSNEVSRIAGTLARLSTAPSVVTPRPSGRAAGIEDISASDVMRVIRARRARAAYFSEELFADPAWDILLDLFHAELTQQRVTVSTLCMAAPVPATTALRWLTSLVKKSLVIRQPDPLDGRRVFVELSPDASSAMRRYFAEALNTPAA